MLCLIVRFCSGISHEIPVGTAAVSDWFVLLFSCFSLYSCGFRRHSDFFRTADCSRTPVLLLCLKVLVCFSLYLSVALRYTGEDAQAAEEKSYGDRPGQPPPGDECRGGGVLHVRGGNFLS